MSADVDSAQKGDVIDHRWNMDVGFAGAAPAPAAAKATMKRTSARRERRITMTRVEDEGDWPPFSRRRAELPA
jgi:hypothetical protein